MTFSRSGHKGFTLIELLVVIAIIGILSSVVLASLNSARVKGRDARRVSDMKQIQLALELYYDANQSFPIAADAFPANASSSVLVASGYISSLPIDPVHGHGATDSYQYQAIDTGGATCSTAPCASYVLSALIEGGVSATPAGDVDGTVGSISCDDPRFCVRP